MGLIANRMAVELFCRLGEKWKKKRENRQKQNRPSEETVQSASDKDSRT